MENDKEQLNVQVQNESSKEKFVYIKGKIRFEEVQDGKIRCGGCNKIYLRIIGHLKQNADCKRYIDVGNLELEWKKFSAKRRSAKYYEKQKKENGELFLKKCAEK